MAELQAREGELKKRNEAFEEELASECVLCATSDVEVATPLKQMKTLSVDTTLHTCPELIEELKAGKQAEWDLDYEIGVLRDWEPELAGRMAEEEAEPL